MFLRRPYHFLLFAGLVLFSFLATPVFSQTDAHSAITTPHVEGEVLVKFTKEKLNMAMVSGSASLNSFAFVQGLRKSDILKAQNISLLKSKRGETADELIHRLQDDPRIEYIEPNYLRSIHDDTVSTRLIPSDPGMEFLWGLDNSGQSVNGVKGNIDSDIDAPEAWKIFDGSTSPITVAVLDTGLDLTHPDFVGNLWDGSENCKDDSGATISSGCPNHGFDFVNNDNNPTDDHGHGTHVASTVGARGNNAEGVAGLHFGAKIMALKVADSEGFVSSENWIRALNFAKQNGARIVNASFGGPTFSLAEEDAIKGFSGVFVAAAGNKNSDVDATPNYPSGYSQTNIIAVAATDSSDHLASFSNFGAVAVDVGAPGVNIFGAIPGGDYLFASGTSMAAPHVAGLAALLWAYAPNLNALQVIADILASGDPIDALAGKTASGKRINAYAALKALATDVTIVSVRLEDDGLSERGKLAVVFRVSDGIGGIPITLKQFEYSTDGGVTYRAPENGDASKALIASTQDAAWNSNSYATFVTGSAPSKEYVWYADFNHADFSLFTSPIQPDVRIRFRVNNAIADSDFVSSNDVVAPTAVLSGVPALFVNTTAVSVTVSGDGVVQYSYILDTVARTDFFDVSVPLALKDLAEGRHTLTVFAKDVFGNIQLRPTSVIWSVDISPPVGTLVNGSGLAMRSSKPVLQFTLSDSGIGLTDAKIMLSCDDVSYTAPFVFIERYDAFDVKSGENGCVAGDGNHIVYAKFQDALGNVSSSVKTETFLVHTVPIIPTILTKPDSISSLTSPSFTLGGLFVTAYKYKLDAADFSDEIPIATPLALANLADGAHTISFIAKDDVGIFQPTETAVSYSWNIITLPPPAPPLPVPVPVVAVLPPEPVVIVPAPALAPVAPPAASGGGGGGGGGGGSAPSVSSGGGGGGGSSGAGSGGGSSSSIVAAPTPIAPISFPAAPQKGIVLGAKTVNLVDGLILKVEGRGLYYIIQNGIRRPLPYATYRKKYHRKSPLVSLSAKLLKDIPRR